MRKIHGNKLVNDEDPMGSVLVPINVNELNYSHMEGLLHDYGIFATEVMAIIRRISKTSWRVRGIDWRVK